MTSRICAALDVDAVAETIEAVAEAESLFRLVNESPSSSEVLCHIHFEGVDDRYDKDHWEFDPSGSVVVSVYRDLDRLESEYRSRLWSERNVAESREGTLAEIDGWWDAGVLRTHAVVATADGFDPPRHIEVVTSVRTIRHHNLLLQVILDAYAPVGEDAAVAPLLDELTARLVEEVGSHLTLETGTVPPEDGG